VRAPRHDAPIGGLKVTTESAWFAARPSGTEDVYKIYGESFKGAEHLAQVQEAAKQVVSDALVLRGPCSLLSRGLRRGGGGARLSAAPLTFTADAHGPMYP